jgi:hypothetical protein
VIGCVVHAFDAASARLRAFYEYPVDRVSVVDRRLPRHRAERIDERRASNESGRFEVYVQAFPKPGARHQVSSDGGTEPRWRRDGRELFYVSVSLKMMAVGVEDATDALKFGIPSPLFEAPLIPQASFGGPAQGQQYDVAKDGQRFLLNLPVGAIRSPLTVILNWPALLKSTS